MTFAKLQYKILFLQNSTPSGEKKKKTEITNFCFHKIDLHLGKLKTCDVEKKTRDRDKNTFIIKFI